jgi:DDE superfamily endonuclease/Helix-turn-helix of DDE superfamily endonuclease
MMTLARLRKKPRHFQSFTGLSVAEFDRLLAEVEPAYAAHLEEQRKRPDRQREVGGGHGFNLEVAERVLLGLIYLRLYVSQSLLSYLFDLHESNISRELNQRLLPVLLSVLPAPLTDAPLRAQPSDREGEARKPRKKIRTVDELFAAYPELKEVLVDATEQEVPKPKDKTDRKQRYSGKQKRHTVKTQVVTTRKQILHVFGGLPGCIADVQLLRASGVLLKLPQGVKVRLDRGFDGIEKAYPQVDLQSPIKGRRGHTVTLLGKLYNRMLNKERILVEHMLAKLQKFKALEGVYRGRWRTHETLFCVVSGLVNYKATSQFQLTGD